MAGSWELFYSILPTSNMPFARDMDEVLYIDNYILGAI
jgi:hypothetical protein